MRPSSAFPSPGPRRLRPALRLPAASSIRAFSRPRRGGRRGEVHDWNDVREQVRAKFLGRVQPYSIYIPEDLDLGSPVALTWMHFAIRHMERSAIRRGEAGHAGTVPMAMRRDALAGLDLPQGAAAELGGAATEQETTFRQLGLAVLAAIAIVYVVLVATFKSLVQPLVLLVSIPFAATGAVLALLASGVPLGLASLVGTLGEGMDGNGAEVKRALAALAPALGDWLNRPAADWVRRCYQLR